MTSTMPHAVLRQTQPDGSIHLASRHALGPVAPESGAWLHHWANKSPERIFLAERSGAGWREHGYGEILAMVKAVAAGFIARGLDAATPIAILSGNGVDHQILSLAAQYIGVPTVPLAEQYSLIPEARGRLAYVLNMVKPVLAFVDDAAIYAGALGLPELENTEIIAVRTGGVRRKVTPFSELLGAQAGPEVDAAHALVGPDTLAKILFTSGSSADPKGVMTTQAMMCANQAQIAAVLPFLKERPHRILDWLPWNHVFGGSHNVNMMLANGGSLYIDHGKPTKNGFGLSLENLRTHAGTLSFNVPVAFAMLVDAMEKDAGLRQAYFGDLDLIFYAGASLPQDVWGKLETMALETRGRLPLMISSWGMTETAPATIMVHEPIGRSGVIGVPLPGVTVKLLPDDDMRCELRVKGPNITPGYFGNPAKTREAFDADGFLITGDAVRFVNAADPDRGLVFDGRVAEDFKLLTGTWVQAGKLRLDMLEQLAGLVQDIVICGHDRGEAGMLIFPRPGHGGNVSDGAVIDPVLQAEIETRMIALAKRATGSASRVSRALVMAEPPSLKDHEITDKGSLNTRRILTRRAALVERLYDNEDPALIRV